MVASHPQCPIAREADPSGAPDGMAGRVFGGRYRVVSRLGEGGMGTVYLCEHVFLGRRFAVKVLRPDRATDPELGERFRQEAIAASSISQENVVDVLDYGREPDGALFYVMEALEGRSLGAVLRDDGPLPVGRALLLLDQVCRALSAAHARGVVHRDVKPENVFVVRASDGGERVKVLDFGISQVETAPGGERITRAGAIIGTPEYMAPEQAAGVSADPRSDVYAVGVLAYELLTGVLPLVGETAIATLVAHQTRAPEPPGRRRPGIPPEVDALVLTALAKRPEGRFDSMDAFAAEITRIRLACLGHEPAGEGRGTPPRDRGRRANSRGGATVALPKARSGGEGPRERRRALVAVAGAAGLGAAVALAALAWRGAVASPVPHPAASEITAASAPAAPRGETRASPPGAPEPVAAPVAAPILVLDAAAPRPGAAPPPARTRPARPARRPGVGPDGADAGAGPEDPYARDELKPDPFR